MRKPKVGDTLAKAKVIATQAFQSKDWRFRFIAVYVLHFYMTPLEIMKFLQTRPSVVRNNLDAIGRIRKNPKLIRLESLSAVLKTPLSSMVPQRKKEH